MTSKLSILVLSSSILAAVAVGCSDEEVTPLPPAPTTTTSGGGGTGGSGGDDTTSTGGMSAGGSSAGGSSQGGMGGMGTGGSGGGVDCSMAMDCRNCCAMQNPVGAQKAQDAVIDSCFCATGATCETECQNDCGMNFDLQNASQACQDCGIAAIFNNDQCVTDADAACTADPDCAEVRSCLENCPMQN